MLLTEAWPHAWVPPTPAGGPTSPQAGLGRAGDRREHPASTSNERLLCVQSSLRPGRRPLSPVTSAGSGHGTKAPRNARLGGGLRRFRGPEARARAAGRACPSAGAECPQCPGCPSARAPGRRPRTLLDSRTHPDPRPHVHAPRVQVWVPRSPSQAGVPSDWGSPNSSVASC